MQDGQTQIVKGSSGLTHNPSVYAPRQTTGRGSQNHCVRGYVSKSDAGAKLLDAVDALLL
jgi:hypothetical protein